MPFRLKVCRPITRCLINSSTQSTMPNLPVGALANARWVDYSAFPGERAPTHRGSRSYCGHVVTAVPVVTCSNPEEHVCGNSHTVPAAGTCNVCDCSIQYWHQIFYYELPDFGPFRVVAQLCRECARVYWHSNIACKRRQLHIILLLKLAARNRDELNKVKYESFGDTH